MAACSFRPPARFPPFVHRKKWKFSRFYFVVGVRWLWSVGISPWKNLEGRGDYETHTNWETNQNWHSLFPHVSISCGKPTTHSVKIPNLHSSRLLFVLIFHIDGQTQNLTRKSITSDPSGKTSSLHFCHPPHPRQLWCLITTRDPCSRIEPNWIKTSPKDLRHGKQNGRRI